MFGSSDTPTDVDFDDFERTAPEPKTIEKPAADAPAPAVTSADIPAELLDAIASVVNAQLPPMVAQCINPEAQREFLAEQLGQPLADFAETLRVKAVSELTGDRSKMQAELEELRAQRKEVSGKREEQKAALLSEQRQRRALSDRNRDLEAKIEELASEIEQHKLTIASLMNKMRVAEVTDGDAAALREDLAALREQIKAQNDELTAKNQEISAKNQEISAKDEEISAKNQELSAKDEELSAKNKELSAKSEEISAQSEEISSLNDKIAELETAAAIADSLSKRREAEGEPQPEKPKRRRSTRRPKARAYDPENDASADIDSIDWLLPGGVPAGHTPQPSDPEFGYQPPKHAPTPDSDLQLTLF